MGDLEHADPFAKSRRSSRIRLILAWGALVVLLSAGFFYFTRSRQSSILLIGSMDDASITLNGRTPNLEDDPRGISIPVYAGKYRLTIARDDRLPFSQDVTVPSGSVLEVRPVFGMMTSAAEEGGGDIDYVRPTADGSTVYYLGNNRQTLYRMETENRVTIPVTTGRLGSISDVRWGNNPEVALIVTTQGTLLRELPIFDFKSQRTVKVADTDILAPIFDPKDDNRLAAALFRSNGEKSLVLTDRVFSHLDRKADLSAFTNPLLTWSPDGRYIGVINRSNDSALNNAWLYTLADGSFRSLTAEGSVLNARFSPDGTGLIYERLESGTHWLRALAVDTGTAYPLSMEGAVGQAAWKNNESFYLPDTAGMTLVTVRGATQRVPYTGPTITDIRSMFYFPESALLIFSTPTSVYTVDMAS